MVFSSPVFLFFLLPLIISLYYLLPRRVRNGWLLAASLFFYWFGEGAHTWVMLASIAFNYAGGLAIGHSTAVRRRQIILAVTVTVNLLLLIAFKYANFLADSLNRLPLFSGAALLELPPIHLPIGISFFTFQAMSYVIDVYRREAPVQRNPFDTALYISLFPHLVAGPILRYHDVAGQLVARHERVDRFASGVQRFIVGFAKKVLIADTVALLADALFRLPPSELTMAGAWLGLLCYTLQIYFDFSGYSDMAIGLGRMVGFEFLENFNYPYIAQSIREFWRRWHISLSNWFRDYLYRPLGGNRGSAVRTHANLLVVFFLCGLWHGASWTFVLWGLYHGFFMVLERLGWGRLLDRAWRPLRHLYALLVVMVGWVFFRADTIGHAGGYLAGLVGWTSATALPITVQVHLTPLFYALLAVALVAATPLPVQMLQRARAALGGRGGHRLAEGAGLVGLYGLFLLAILRMAGDTYHPFIYFRF